MFNFYLHTHHLLLHPLMVSVKGNPCIWWSLSQHPASHIRLLERLLIFFLFLTKKNLMKEGCSQEEHQQQNDIWYFKSNTIGCNRRDSRCNRRGSRCNRRGNRSNRRGGRCDRRGSRYHAKAGFHLTTVEHLNGAVIVNNVYGVVVLHRTQAIQL